MDTPEEVAADLGRLEAATQRLTATVKGWGAGEVAAPSLLPGWSRAHVLSHIARNADGMRAILLGARVGVPVAMYPSREVRSADIEAGATRPASVVLEDLLASAERFALDAAHLPSDGWSAEVTFGVFTTAAAGLIAHRLREVETHHIDLGAGYTFADTPDDVAVGFLDQLPIRFGDTDLAPCTIRATDLDREWRIADGGGPTISGPTISGPAAAVLRWATGRGGPDGLISDAGQVPASPGWG